DLVVAPDDRIELAASRGLGEIAGVFLERVVGALGRGSMGGAALAQGVDGGIEVLRRDAGARQDLSGLAVLVEGEREQQSLDRHVAIAGLFGGLLRGIEHARRSGREIELPGAAAGNFR